MLLAVLAFFVSAILGGLANQAVAGVTDKHRTPRFALVALVIAIGYEFLAFHAPFRSTWTELAYALLGTLTVILVMVGLPIESQTSRPIPATGRAGCSAGVVFLLLPVVSFTLVGRVGHAQEIAAEYRGLIVSKYKSHNHAAPSFKLLDGEEIEGVDPAAWDAAVEGQSRLDKPPWSAFGDLDGRRTRIVRQGKVMFLGPFAD